MNWNIFWTCFLIKAFRDGHEMNVQAASRAKKEHEIEFGLFLIRK